MRTFEDNWKALATNGWGILISLSIFFTILLVATIIGAKRGFYAALMSLGFNSVGFIIGLILAPIILDTSISLKHSNANLMNKLIILKPMLVGIIILSFTALVAIIGEIIYALTKDFFKRSIIKRMNKGESTVFYRSMGAVAAGISALPGAILTTNLAGFVDQNSFINNANNSVLNFLTVGQAKGVSKYAPGLVMLNKIKNDEQFKKDIFKYVQSIFNLDNYVFKMKSKSTIDKTLNDEKVNSGDTITNNKLLSEIWFVPLANWSDDEIERLPKIKEWLNFILNDEDSLDLLYSNYKYSNGQKYTFAGLHSKEHPTWHTKITSDDDYYYYKKFQFGNSESWSPETQPFEETKENKFDFKTMFSWNVEQSNKTISKLLRKYSNHRFAKDKDTQKEDFSKVEKIANEPIFSLDIQEEQARKKLISIFYEIVFPNDKTFRNIEQKDAFEEYDSTKLVAKNKLDEISQKKFHLVFNKIIESILQEININ
ncbi:DUF4013 domain-containing protein [Mycoplasmopsis caviae]|uniref:DUF4013 domain-containing protein n=1 Tax=Mycoplasmopsis caviae TaxID=55603 RepID=A0A3P8KLY6_9BACT|nr:DUF4013 domain-containing protein [Mycoplasmopsis caviae]UUD35445.1 DUF4013 domain-containing protein [Mycoplasmopsis caviae]VDR41778.1 Uncharacterised protein [Mycoplasmopsis caviae]